MKVHPIPHSIFETTKSRFIQILHRSAVSWKITPLYFSSSNLVYFVQKKSMEKKYFQTFEWFGKISPNSYLKHKSAFLWTLHHSSVSWEITLLYFFSWNFMWFGQNKEFQTFDCSCKISPNLYFDRLLSLKVCNISAKKV